MKIINNMLAVFVVAIILLIVIPLPPVMLDIMIIFNILVSLIIMLNTMYTKDALEFSAFPSLLLITTLFRVGLNVSSTRLILSNNGHAGQVIKTFGNFVIGDNVVVGVVVFIIIVVIQFIVITKGAERVSEVAARFTLDAMPGKQMSIDADLNSGIIDEKTAIERRNKIQRSADFYGAMDGATKFVKGDAIISIVIIFVNIIGGAVTGLMSGMGDMSGIMQTYTIATIGDGLVAQLPALMISTATAMIVTRAASENSLSAELTSQLFSQSIVLIIAGGAMYVLCLIPGMPKLPLLVLATFFVVIGVRLKKESAAIEKEDEPKIPETDLDFYRDIENVYSLLSVEQIEMEFGYSIVQYIDSPEKSSFMDRVVMLRKQIAAEYGFVIPSVRLRDNIQLSPGEYVIKIKGEQVAKGEVLVDHYLAMPGEDQLVDEIEGIDVIEPVFGSNAKWITDDQKEDAEVYGYAVVDAISVIITHLSETVKRHSNELLGRQEVSQILENVKKYNRGLVEDTIPSVISIGDLQKILGNLLSESLPIKDMITILETICDYGSVTKDTDMLTEYVRQALKRTISRLYVRNNKLNAIVLDPELEKSIMSSVRKTEHGSYVAMQPDAMQRIVTSLIEELKKVKGKGDKIIVLTSPVVRFYFRKMTEQLLPEITILSYNELESNVQVTALATIQ
ncbi:MAG: flagellar biosynthesis protein FlhA [Oscillospiraceae bacterium]|nr:flagellar biosynthesis protein FlhA [Oscillospiraceae bacterium]